MKLLGGRTGGYSLVELLVVLSIVGVLSLAAVMAIRPRTTDSVRSIMSEVEGVILNAQRTASKSTQDVYISTDGAWNAGTLIIDARPLVTTAIVTTPPLADLTPGNDAQRMGPGSECFRSKFLQRDRDHVNAGIDTSGAWLTVALGSGANLKDLAFFNTTPMAGFKTALGAPLCNGSFNFVVLNSISHNFITGFCVVVVGLVNGTPVVNGPVGILVVPAGGGNIFKYFKPNGSSTWGRL